MSEDGHEFGFGPGPETWAQGAAILSAGLAREARIWAEAAAALRAAAQPVPGTEGDLRRARLARAEAEEAALRAALALSAAGGLDGDAAASAQRIAEAAKRAGVPPLLLLPLLRAAALSPVTDDAAARIAAGALAQAILSRLEG
ncbi:MAG: hypothetical protein NZM27_11095 [Acetobacteraceae bacterium]|nr:hypothetical protein [Acetobacteraceae bacterium]MCX7684248.1 hypothetical protein [Acetobacteraceae bacterium]MDW8398522.1 hypothetical protein [Acetobacteraceae bacterium]